MPKSLVLGATRCFPLLGLEQRVNLPAGVVAGVILGSGRGEAVPCAGQLPRKASGRFGCCMIAPVFPVVA